MKILEGTQASVPPQGGRKHPHQEFLTIDTTNVLFICGGAFANLDKVIERRIGHKGVGFAAAIEDKAERDKGEVFEHCLPEDLIEYGLIPEFIGRLPVVSAVHQLTREDLVSILVEPRNALVKQFQRFFSFDGIELVFSEDSLTAVAEKGLARRDGRPWTALDHRGDPARGAIRASVAAGREEVRRDEGDRREGADPDARHRSRARGARGRCAAAGGVGVARSSAECALAPRARARYHRPMVKRKPQNPKSKASRVRALPWAALLQGGIVVARRWRSLSERERERLTSLLRESRGRLGNLSSSERRELRKLAGKLDVKGMGGELRALLHGKRRGKRR